MELRTHRGPEKVRTVLAKARQQCNLGGIRLGKSHGGKGSAGCVVAGATNRSIAATATICLEMNAKVLIQRRSMHWDHRSAERRSNLESLESSTERARLDEGEAGSNGTEEPME